MEIGASVEAEVIRLQKKDKRDKDGYTYYDLKEKNQLKFTHNDLTITTFSIDFVGNIGDPEVKIYFIHSFTHSFLYFEYIIL